MDKVEKKKLQMFEGTLKAMNHYKDEWQNKPHIVTSVNELAAKIELLNNEHDLQLDLKEVATDYKKDFRYKTESSAMLVVALLKVFADVTQNDELLAELRYTKSGFIHNGSKEMVFDAGQIYDLGTAHLLGASTYGLSQEFLDDLQLNLTGLKSNVNKPGEQRKLLKECTVRIKVLVKEIEDSLKARLDNQLELFKNSKSEFYKVYHLARKPLHSATIKLAMRFKITDAQTKEPVAKAMVIIKDHLKRKSSPKGQIRLRNLPEGKYNLTVSMPGYVAQTIKITRVKDVTGVVNVDLVAVK